MLRRVRHANFWRNVSSPHPIDVGSFWPWQHNSTAIVSALTAVAVVQVGSLFSVSDAWNNVTFTAGEIRNPKRNSAAERWLSVRGYRPAAVYVALQLHLSERASAFGRSERADDAVAG